MLQAELYALYFQNPEPSYYSRIPHILDHLTYDEINPKTGKIEIKRLSVYAKELYRVFKSIAGDKGACWQNRNKLAELSNMSTGSITNAKKELCKNFHQLDKNPLITITKEKKKTPTNGTEYHKIIILDIWRWNNAYMGTRKFHKDEDPNNEDFEEARSPNDGLKEARSPNDGPNLGTRSPHDTNKKTITKTHMFKEQQPAAAYVRPFEKKENVPKEEKVSSPEDKAYDWFLELGCTSKEAAFFVGTYSISDIEKGCQYTRDYIAKNKKKGQTIKNKIGYLRTVMDKKYWLQKGNNYEKNFNG